MLLKLFGVLLSTVSLFAIAVVTNSTFLIPLTNANATQSETWQTHNASLAIDNDVTTWSVAASQATPGAIGWWKVDLGQTYDVSDVAITSSLDFYNSMYLQAFAINVTTEAGLDTLCYLYNSTISIPVGSTFLLTCSQGPVTGRYVEVWRLPGSTFRQDGLAIAEINIYASNIRSGGVSNYEAEKLVYGADLSYEVSLANHPAYQSRTWGLEGPEKAIDNNVTTFSVACITCNETLTSEPGWWMVDLLNETAVAGVVILASSDPYSLVSITTWLE
ncbi:hypothetical protein HELRODRAFT_167351 [Helobdella robusta]|uniref:F5/8 type C domain-containing protein n=1 Tax=Helobdella robusta TaxID=6412 RepID=T1EZA6_HELRO|nr:hypothetical protein HELRODRAFT_167351 [Helobdella robusta]ESO10848.1 hypothetical protein HELRODRAFT_167351 [Helobdella robusta]